MYKYALILVLFIIAMSTIGAKNLRKPITIAATNYQVIVVCNDGTVWQKYLSSADKYEWTKLSSIPQE